MRTLCKGLLTGILLCFLTSVWSNEQSVSWYKIDDKKQVTLRVDLFLSSTCSHCIKADQFFKSIKPDYTWLDVHRHFINQDKTALETYHLFQQQLNLDDFMVPAIFFCNTRWTGFSDAQKTGALLLKNMQYCREQISKTGTLSKTVEQILQQKSNASWYEESMTSKPGTLSLLLTMSVIDALTPGTAFLILSLFSLLMIQKRQGVRYGGTVILFLIGAGIAHFSQQAFTASFYQMLAVFRLLAAATGAGLLAWLFFCHSRFVSVKRSAPVIVSSILVLLTGLAVQAYQQMHATNFALIFQQWLMSQSLTPLTRVLYDLAYQLVYLLVIGLLSLLMVSVFKYYSKWAKHENFVSEFAWQYLLVIGLVLLAWPYLLANVLFSFLVFILVLIFTWASNKIWSRHVE